MSTHCPWITNKSTSRTSLAQGRKKQQRKVIEASQKPVEASKILSDIVRSLQLNIDQLFICRPLTKAIISTYATASHHQQLLKSSYVNHKITTKHYNI